jgi:predicted transcriptional regulator
MRSAFKTLAEIARNFGVDVSTVRGYLRGDVKPRQP